VTFGSLQGALDWLETHVDYERTTPRRRDVPTLQPIVDSLTALADPHHDYPSIHVTGTNGKGTTTMLVAALLTGTGLRVGTFTSPDLHSVNERIAVGGEPIDDEAFTLLLSRLADVEKVTGIVLTRFEILTVGAFLHFSDEGVDAAVIEVGLGGTWDSTNVIDSDVAVLTNVDLDHVAVLGPTVADIASDKAGIFRPGAVAVLGTEEPVAVGVAEKRAAEIGADLRRRGTDFDVVRNDVSVGGRLLTLRSPFETYEDVDLTLHGIHQGDNAVTALAATELFLGRALGDRVVRETFSHATMPGRLEVLSRRPLIVADGAHNPAGVISLARALDGAFHVEGRRVAVLGMLVGREVEDMVAPLVEAGFDEFFCAPPASARALSAVEVGEAIRRRGGQATICTTVSMALAQARERSSDDDLIVACGSLYLVGEVRSIVLGVPSRHR
jgi:dihydrofolate synthase/folylpolyglutamate synthase